MQSLPIDEIKSLSTRLTHRVQNKDLVSHFDYITEEYNPKWVAEGTSRTVVPLSMFGDEYNDYVIKIDPFVYDYQNIQESENYIEAKAWQQIQDDEYVDENLFVPITDYNEQSYSWVIMPEITPTFKSDAPRETTQEWIVDTNAYDEIHEQLLDSRIFPCKLSDNICIVDGTTKVFDYGELLTGYVLEDCE